MKINLYKFVVENSEKFDLTNKQIKVLEYILDKDNFLKSKSEIADACRSVQTISYRSI